MNSVSLCQSGGVQAGQDSRASPTVPQEVRDWPVGPGLPELESPSSNKFGRADLGTKYTNPFRRMVVRLTCPAPTVATAITARHTAGTQPV